MSFKPFQKGGLEGEVGIKVGRRKNEIAIPFDTVLFPDGKGEAIECSVDDAPPLFALWIDRSAVPPCVDEVDEPLQNRMAGPGQEKPDGWGKGAFHPFVILDSFAGDDEVKMVGEGSKGLDAGSVVVEIQSSLLLQNDASEQIGLFGKVRRCCVQVYDGLKILFRNKTADHSENWQGPVFGVCPKIHCPVGVDVPKGLNIINRLLRKGLWADPDQVHLVGDMVQRITPEEVDLFAIGS